MEGIKKELLELNFDVESIGIIYWVEAIKIVKENPLEWRVGEIYSTIADKYNTTYSKIEREMRYSITPAKKNIQKKYGYYDKIKNSTFLSLIRYKLI